MDESLTNALDGTRMVYTYPEMGTVRVEFGDGRIGFEWLAGPLEGQVGNGFAYRARQVGDDQFFVNWHEPEARGLVTLHVDFEAGKVRSAVFAGYATDDEQILFHEATIDRLEASARK